MPISVILESIKTKDGISLDGIFARPRQKSDTALIWIHGLGSNFARGQTLIKELSEQCAKNSIAYFKFNTRGHDVVNRDAPDKKGLQGSGFEKFEDCVRDIRAMIGFARRHGYKKIILAGHSTGANKALYYLYKTRDPAIKGLMLVGAVSDISAGRKKFGLRGLARGVAWAEKLSKKNPEELMPRPYGIFSAQRFLSIFQQNSDEDVFPYLNPAAQWKELKSIRIPVAVIFGSRDEYLNQPAQKLMEIFRAHAPLAKSPAPHLSWTAYGTHDILSGKGAGFTSAIIKNADHGFKRKEKELARKIIRWVKSSGL